MHNRSLVWFTLFVQSAVGLVWVGIAGNRFAGTTQAGLFMGSMVLALVLTGLGLSAALTHLSRPRRAPHALRNLAASWLSREVLLVQSFAGVVALIILSILLDISSGRMALEIAACLLGGAVLFAMTRVYLLKTVPLWNSAATPMEFVGTVLLLGGSWGALCAPFGATAPSTSTPAMMVSAASVLLGLILKFTAISPALAAEKAARARTWYPSTATSLSTGQMLAVRAGLNLAGLVLILIIMGGSGPAWLWSSLCLICFGTAEVMGRLRFYNAYSRIGL